MSDINILLDNGTQIDATVEIATDAHGKLHLQVTLECLDGSGLAIKQIAVTALSRQVEKFVRDSLIHPTAKYERSGLEEAQS